MVKLNKLQLNTLANKIARDINAERSKQRELHTELLKNSEEVNNFINSIQIYIDGLNNDIIYCFTVKLNITFSISVYKDQTIDYIKEIYIKNTKSKELDKYKNISVCRIEEELILSSIEATDLQTLTETITQKFI